MRRPLLKILVVGLSLVMVADGAFAQRVKKQVKSPRRASRSASIYGGPNPLNEAMAMAKEGKYAEASQRLFQLSVHPRFAAQRMQIKYLLGLTLMQMKLHQVAAFQFIAVVRDGRSKYVKQSLEKLSLAADALGDDTLLNYAISRVRVDQFPRIHRDMLNYRIGEFLLRTGQRDQAIQSLSRVDQGSNFYPQARYLEALAYAESNRPSQAAKIFDDLAIIRGGHGITDPARVAAIVGKARALYQKKDWDGAIEAYREVPRDTDLWHDTLFESSWAMLRSGRFRSALSNFQSLHSAYYEDFYLPESLLLRSIVYLYICKYDEMEKVLDLFSRVYKPAYDKVNDLLKEGRRTDRLFVEVTRKIMQFKTNLGDDETLNKMRDQGFPLVLARKVWREGDFQNSFNYIRRLVDERKRISAQPASWRSSGLGRYADKVIKTRVAKARVKASRQVAAHLEAVREELVDLFEQEGFIRYEMINGRKESLKKKIAGKDIPQEQVDSDSSRDFYIQNGYEYWPFRGEHWLDELGNYHYVGVQSCE